MLLTKHIGTFAAVFATLCGTSLWGQDFNTVYVTSTNDSGEGSLRAALVQAAEERKQIVVTTDGEIELAAPLVYEGDWHLHLSGSGQTIRLRDNGTILSVMDGSALHITNLNFMGRGGYSIENRADLDGPAGKGIFFQVGDDNVGHVSVSLTNSSVRGVPGHGIHISDCDLGDDCGAGGDGAGVGSAASIKVNLLNVTIDGVGYGRFDADGLRVDERGPGDIEFVGTNVDVLNVGADGIELDEGDAGQVRVHLTRAPFRDNGSYCDPDLLEAFMPDWPEAEFDESAMQEADIPALVSGSPDDRCFEREIELYDDGSVEAYEFAIDLDDGFDIDESGEGDIQAFISEIDVMQNTDEGLDFDEAGDGDLRLNMIQARFTQNRDDGVKLSEEGGGDLVADIARGFAFGNGGKGFVFEEADAGDLSATAIRTETNGNDDGDDSGIEAVQDDAGSGTLYVLSGAIADGIDSDGISVILD